jgi:hypothetical protein
MNYNPKKVLSPLIILFIVLTILIYVTKTFNSLGVFIFDFSLAFIVIFIILIWAPKDVFIRWLKFTFIFLVLSIITVVVTPETGSDFIFPIDKKVATFSLSILFVIISVIIVLVKKYRSR